MTTHRDNRWMSEPMTVSRFKDLIRKNSIDAAFHVVPMGIVMPGGGVDVDVPGVHYSRLVEIWAYRNQARCDADTDGLVAMARAYVIDDEYVTKTVEDWSE